MSVSGKVAHRLRLAIGEHNFFGFRWIIEKFNDVDFPRLREIGPDRLAAEWILRCGGSVRFDKYPQPIDDYNSLIKKTAVIDPRVEEQQVHLTHAHAVNSCVTARGCRHFEGLTGLYDVRFVNCKNLEDEGMATLVKTVGNTLEYAEIATCRYLTDDGIRYLAECKNLKSLILADLHRVRHRQKVYEFLKERLPSGCEVHYEGLGKEKKK